MSCLLNLTNIMPSGVWLGFVWCIKPVHCPSGVSDSVQFVRLVCGPASISCLVCWYGANTRLLLSLRLLLLQHPCPSGVSDLVQHGSVWCAGCGDNGQMVPNDNGNAVMITVK